MADTPKTQIAQELKRIQEAKSLLGQKAGSLGLVYEDEDGHRHVVTSDALIQDIASAYEDIDFYNQSDAEHTGHSTNGKTVNLAAGYYTQQSVSVQEGSVAIPTVTLNPGTGEATASVAVTEGYVTDAPLNAIVDLTDYIPGFAPENFKVGFTIFGETGTFTADATVPTTGTDAVLESSHITKDFTAYKNGKMVMGTLENYDSAQTYNSFNPLEDNNVVFEGPVRYGHSLTVGLSNDLLEALQAI